MITIRAIYEDRRIEFIDEVIIKGRQKVLMTFPELDDNILISGNREIYEFMQPILDDRDQQMLRLVQQGANNRKIAEVLKLNKGTTKNRLSKIFRKLRVHNRGGAIKKAVEIGFLGAFTTPVQRIDEIINLSKREIQILSLVQGGATNMEIANELKMKKGSISNNLYEIYKKLKVKSRLEAIRKAMEMGIIEPINRQN